jgi:chromosome segregation ATPase
MGLFGKKKLDDTVTEKNGESILNEERESKIEDLEKIYSTNQDEINEITQKIQTVKEEYDEIVSNLMLVKKEHNQKRMELDIILREYKEVKEKIKNSEQIKDSKSINQFKKTEEDLTTIKDNLKNTKEKLEEKINEYDEIAKKITKEQSILHNIKKQQLESEKELEEANSRLYNAKIELEQKDQFQETEVLSLKEKEFIEGNNNIQSSAGVIEAASVVVGSLKSKLSTTQKELESIQLQLEKEIEEHKKTRNELEKLKKF